MILEKCTRLEALTGPGGGRNYDAFGYSGNMFWVLDGATGLSPRAEEDLADFVATVNRLIEETAIRFAAWPLFEIMAIVASHIRPRYSRNRRAWERPSCCVAIARFCDSELEYFVLGDATLAVRQGAQTIIVTDDSVLRLDWIAIAEKHHLQEQGMTSQEARQAIIPLLRKHREMMNTPEGYWIFNGDAEACRHAKMGCIPLAAGNAQVILATDGFARLVDTFAAYDWPALLDKAKADSLSRMYSELRAIESGDAECAAYPRFAKSDDAAAVYLEFEVKGAEA